MYNIQSHLTQQGTPGTLSTEGYYNQPNVPAVSGASGIQGTDGRAYTRQIGPGELVEDRLNSLLGSDSAYIQQARRNAQMQAQSRGLGNSSIAGGAGVRAAIESGLPIASQDAQAVSAAQSQNMDALNQNLMQEREVSNRMLEGERDRGMQASALAANRAAEQARLEMQLQMQRENLAYAGEQAGLGRAHDLNQMMTQFGLQDQFNTSELGRTLAQMGYQFNLGEQGADSALLRNLFATGTEYSWRNDMANNDAMRQNWLSNSDFERNLYGGLIGGLVNTQLSSFSDINAMITQYALQNPDVFNAQDYQNFSNFTNQNMSNVLGNLFSRMFGNSSG